VEFIGVDAPELWHRPPDDRVNLSNGILMLGSRELTPHTHEYLSPVRIPVTYAPAATCPAIERFVRQVFPADAIEAAYQIPALLMTPLTSHQCAILLLGAGGNGKSRYLQLLAGVGQVRGRSALRQAGERVRGLAQ
jgi:phage/plasmid-associated DNA primase